jgi:hypothetical protein
MAIAFARRSPASPMPSTVSGSATMRFRRKAAGTRRQLQAIEDLNEAMRDAEDEPAR